MYILSTIQTSRFLVCLAAPSRFLLGKLFLSLFFLFPTAERKEREQAGWKAFPGANDIFQLAAPELTVASGLYFKRYGRRNRGARSEWRKGSWEVFALYGCTPLPPLSTLGVFFGACPRLGLRSLPQALAACSCKEHLLLHPSLPYACSFQKSCLSSCLR